MNNINPKEWSAEVRPVGPAGNTARVIVVRAGGPAAVGGAPPRRERRYDLVTAGPGATDVFDLDVAANLARRFNTENFAAQFVRGLHGKVWTHPDGLRMELRNPAEPGGCGQSETDRAGYKEAGRKAYAPHAVYRAEFPDGTAFYGITTDPETRFQGFPEGSETEVVEWFPNRQAAVLAERDLTEHSRRRLNDRNGTGG